MSQKKEFQQVPRETVVAHICDTCGKEEAGIPAWRAPDDWIEVVEYPGFPECDPDNYHLCSAECFAKFADDNAPGSHRAWYEVKVRDLSELLVKTCDPWQNP